MCLFICNAVLVAFSIYGPMKFATKPFQPRWTDVCVRYFEMCFQFKNDGHNLVVFMILFICVDVHVSSTFHPIYLHEHSWNVVCNVKKLLTQDAITIANLALVMFLEHIEQWSYGWKCWRGADLSAIIDTQLLHPESRPFRSLPSDIIGKY